MRLIRQEVNLARRACKGLVLIPGETVETFGVWGRDETGERVCGDQLQGANDISTIGLSTLSTLSQNPYIPT